MKNAEARVIKCPRCRKDTNWNNNPYRPFCSEKCQQIDLGKWAQEEYCIGSENVPDQECEE